jgi:hypothetical protein
VLVLARTEALWLPHVQPQTVNTASNSSTFTDEQAPSYGPGAAFKDQGSTDPFNQDIVVMYQACSAELYRCHRMAHPAASSRSSLSVTLISNPLTYDLRGNVS